MRIIERGSGTPIVVVPGVQGRWEYFAPAIDALARSFRVVTFSLCGELGCPRIRSRHAASTTSRTRLPRRSTAAASTERSSAASRSAASPPCALPRSVRTGRRRWCSSRRPVPAGTSSGVMSCTCDSRGSSRRLSIAESPRRLRREIATSHSRHRCTAAVRAVAAEDGRARAGHAGDAWPSGRRSSRQSISPVKRRRISAPTLV